MSRKKQDVVLNSSVFPIIVTLTTSNENSNQISKKLLKAQSTIYEHLLNLEKEQFILKTNINNKFKLNLDKIIEEFLKFVYNETKEYGIKYKNFNKFSVKFNSSKLKSKHIKYLNDLKNNEILKNIIVEFLKNSKNNNNRTKTLLNVFEEIKNIMINSYIFDYFETVCQDFDKNKKPLINKSNKDFIVFIHFLRDLILISQDENYLKNQSIIKNVVIKCLEPK